MVRADTVRPLNMQKFGEAKCKVLSGEANAVMKRILSCTKYSD